MHYTFGVLWLFYLLIGKTLANSCDSSFHPLLTNGRILDGSSFWESKTHGAIECARSCVRMKKCKSFNFNKETMVCELNAQLGTRSKLDKDVVSSDISLWSSQIDPDCYDRPCTENEVCLPGKLTDGTACSYTCFKLSRKCPPPEGTLSSQPRTIGSLFTHTCRRGLMGGDSALCLPSGKWNKPINTTCTPVLRSNCHDDTDCTPITGNCIDHVCSCRTGSEYDSKEMSCADSMVEGACEKGWFHSGKKCYLFGDQLMEFSDATEFCKDEGDHLVQIDLEEENLFLKGILANLSTSRNYWIDLYQFGKNGQERWYTTNDSLIFSDWVFGEPDDGDLVETLFLPSERCTFMTRDKPYAWVDVMCENAVAAPLCQTEARNK